MPLRSAGGAQAEPGQHGQRRAGARRSDSRSPSLARMLATWVSTVRSVSHSRRAMPALVRPSAISASTSRSRGGQQGERVVRAASGPSKVRDHLRVERRAAGGDPAQRVEEVVDVEDAVLEQVAEVAAGRPARRSAGSRRAGRAARCRARGQRSRSSRAARAPSSVRSGGMRTSTMARSGRARPRPPRPASARRRRWRRPRGRRPRAAGPAPRGRGRSPRRSRCAWQRRLDCRAAAPRAGDRSEPPSAATRSASPEPAPQRCAPPRPSSLIADDRRGRSGARPTQSTIRVASACLTALVSASLTTKYAVVATSSGSAPASDVQLDRRPARARDERGEGGAEPVVEAAGPQAVRDLAQLGDRGAELGDAWSSSPSSVDGAVVEVPLRQPQRHAQRDQPLLGAVVQVALEPAPLLVADLDQPGPARLDLAQRAGSSSREPDHLDDRGRPVGDLPQQLRRRLGAPAAITPTAVPPSCDRRRRRSAPVRGARGVDSRPRRAAGSPTRSSGSRSAGRRTCPRAPPGVAGHRSTSVRSASIAA